MNGYALPNQKSAAQVAVEANAALTLMYQGHSQRQIMDIFKEQGIEMSQPTVKRRLDYAIEHIQLPEVEAARSQEVARLDSWVSVLGPAIAKGDEKAINTALKVVALKAKLLGLEAPRKVETTNSGPQPQFNVLMQQNGGNAEPPQYMDADVVHELEA